MEHTDETVKEEMGTEQILAQEMDILAGILECASGKTANESYSTIEIIKGVDENGQPYRRIVKYESNPVPYKPGEQIMIRFRMRGLDQSEYSKCKEDATTYAKHKNMGIKMPENFNAVRFHDSLIHLATHPDDKDRLWNNREAWKKLDVLNGIDMVSKMLYAGEKDALIALLDDKSGYSVDLEETAKK